jgi:hypothetical protein
MIEAFKSMNMILALGSLYNNKNEEELKPFIEKLVTNLMQHPKFWAGFSNSISNTERLMNYQHHIASYVSFILESEEKMEELSKLLNLCSSIKFTKISIDGKLGYNLELDKTSQDDTLLGTYVRTTGHVTWEMGFNTKHPYLSKLINMATWVIPKEGKSVIANILITDKKDLVKFLSTIKKDHLDLLKLKHLFKAMKITFTWSIIFSDYQNYYPLRIRTVVTLRDKDSNCFMLVEYLK